MIEIEANERIVGGRGLAVVALIELSGQEYDQGAVFPRSVMRIAGQRQNERSCFASRVRHE